MSRLFRKSFLLSLRDETDDLTFVSPQRHVQLFWPTVFLVTLAFALLTAWLFTARLSVTVEARGVVMPLGGVREVAALGRGIVMSAKENGSVAAGQIIATLVDPTATAEYDSQRTNYQLVAAFVESQNAATENSYVSKTKELNLRLDGTRANIARLRSISSAFDTAREQRAATEVEMLRSQEKSASEVKKIYDGMQEGSSELLEKGFTSKRDYVQLKQGQASLLQTLSQISIDKARGSVEMQQLRRETSEIVNQIASQTAEEEATLGALDEARSKRDNDIDSMKIKENETRSQLLDAERKLWLNSNIVAPYDGELLALKKGLGQAVSQGESVALVSMVPQTPKSMLVFSPRAKRGSIVLSHNGRQVTVDFDRQQQGFADRLTGALEKLVPNTAFKATYAGDDILIEAPGQSDILKQIDLRDVDLTDSDGVPVFAMLFPVGDNWAAQDLTMVVLVRPEDAKRVKVGDYVLVKPDFEKSLIGAQIEAHVTQVSSYVATTIESQALIGSAEVARSLASNQQGIPQGVAAVLRFDKDANGQLKIHGTSLARTLTSGSTAIAHIRVDQASPIAVLLPFYADVFK